MFPSLATPENMTRNNFSTTMFPSLARALERFRMAFAANDKREIRVYVFLKKWVHGRKWYKTILAFYANAKLLNFN